MKENIKHSSVKLILDLNMSLFAYTLTYVLKFEGEWLNYVNYENMIIYLLMICFIFIFLEIPQRSWTYTSLDGIIKIIGGAFLAVTLFGLYNFLTTPSASVYFYIVLFFLNAFFCISGRHLYMEGQLLFINPFEKKADNTLIVGAGEAGGNLLRESKHNPNFKYNIVGIIDDDPIKAGMLIQGIKVVGKTFDIPSLVKKLKIKIIVIAIPSATPENIKRIYKAASSSGALVKVLPVFDQLLQNEPYTKQLKEIHAEELLGREQEAINKKGVDKIIGGKTIFITGGGGSIGSELSRQIAAYTPKKIINIDISENSLYFLELELKDSFPGVEIISEICSIRDKEKLEWLFDNYRPELVFHTAAHKHVPLMETNPEEAIKNNVFGTKNLIDCADTYKVKRFVMISTDKAVNPANIMGATKRIGEMLISEKNKQSSTKFIAVRFGNVLGSEGSVIPLFKRLIANGQNITLTHPDVTRYFMTIPEAVQLVIEASAIGNGGEIFILDMGKPVKIMDLAKNIIQLSGLKMGEDINIDIVGLRPGEKLFEELLYSEDKVTKTANSKIFVEKLQEEKIDINVHLNNLAEHIKIRDREAIRNELKILVKTYKGPKTH